MLVYHKVVWYDRNRRQYNMLVIHRHIVERLHAILYIARRWDERHITESSTQMGGLLVWESMSDNCEYLLCGWGIAAALQCVYGWALAGLLCNLTMSSQAFYQTKSFLLPVTLIATRCEASWSEKPMAGVHRTFSVAFSLLTWNQSISKQLRSSQWSVELVIEHQP